MHFEEETQLANTGRRHAPKQKLATSYLVQDYMRKTELTFAMQQSRNS